MPAAKNVSDFVRQSREGVQNKAILPFQTGKSLPLIW